MMVMVVVIAVVLRKLERAASGLRRLLLLGPKRVDGVRNRIQQFREGLGGFEAAFRGRGRGGGHGAAAHEGERRGAAKKSKHRFVHGVSLS